MKVVETLVAAIKTQKALVELYTKKLNRRNAATRWETELLKAESHLDTLVHKLARELGGVRPENYWPEPATKVGEKVVFIKGRHMVELVAVKSVMGGLVWESPDTPWHCSVQSESYWSA